jgi:3-methyladenine DNA glycosylase AlkD
VTKSLGWQDQATAHLADLLQAAADEGTRNHWTAYLKGAASFRGVPMDGVRRAVRTVVSDHDLLGHADGDLLALAWSWTARPDSEDKLAAVLLLAEHLPRRLRTEHADQLAVPLAEGHIADWNVCDWYAVKALHAYLTPSGAADQERARRLADWTRASGLWQRRAGLVAFVKTAGSADRQFDGYTDLVLQACAANLVVPDRFAHTGPGWVLRELSGPRPDHVAAFLEQHPELSREGRRMATARMRAGSYRRR